MCLSHSLTGSLVCAGEASSYKSQQSDIKAKAKAAYQQAEKETTIGSVVFDQGPLTKGITACDLGVPSHRVSLILTHTRARAHTHSLAGHAGGRATTASNTEAKKNMSKVMVDATGATGKAEGGGGARPPPLPPPFGPSPVRCACV